MFYTFYMAKHPAPAFSAEDYRFARWEGVVTGDIHASSGTFGVRGNVSAVFKKISGLMLTVR